MAEVKAYLEREGGKRIPCRFNPSELQVTLSNNWSADSVPGGEAPELVFAGGGSGSMSLSLVLDTTDEGRTVTKYTDQLIDLMKEPFFVFDYPGITTRRRNSADHHGSVSTGAISIPSRRWLSRSISPSPTSQRTARRCEPERISH